MKNSTFSRRTMVQGLGLAGAGFALIGCSDSEEATADAGTSAAPSGEAAKVLEAAVLEDKVLGNADAPITLVEYASATCPHCAAFHKDVLPTIKKEYIETGKVKYIHRELAGNNAALAAFMLARCAPNDGYYPFLDVIYAQQHQWGASDNLRQALFDISKLAGFTKESFEACLTDQTLVDGLNEGRDNALKNLGVNATPTVFLNGEKFSGSNTAADLSKAIDELL